VSPVWLQLRRRKDGSFDIEGVHDIDTGWMKDVRSGASQVQILPRLLFDQWSGADYQAVLTSEDAFKELTAVVASFCRVKKIMAMSCDSISVWVFSTKDK
jgi:chitinase domain-containing protein 1